MKNYKKSLILLLIVTILIGMVIACDDEPAKMTPAEARAAFLTKLDGKLADVDKTTVKRTNYDITVEFDDDAGLNELLGIATGLVDTIKNMTDGATLTLGGEEFKYNAISATNIAPKILGVDDYLLLKGKGQTVAAVAKLAGDGHDVVYKADVTDNKGVSFSFNGNLNFKVKED